jgi:hypothetical protein
LRLRKKIYQRVRDNRSINISIKPHLAHIMCIDAAVIPEEQIKIFSDGGISKLEGL